MDALQGFANALAVLAVACAVLVIAVGVVRASVAGRAGAAAAQLAAALALGLDFLVAAGLLRLSFVATFTGLALVAATIALRKVIGVGLRSGLRALGATGRRLIRA